MPGHTGIFGLLPPHYLQLGGYRVPIFPFRSSLMNINLTFGPVVSLIAGVLILIMPRLLNYIIPLYLIVIGLVGLFGTGNLHL